jgi:hypothetical protein
VNGYGVGLTVGLGCVIGLALNSAGPGLAEYALTFAFYAFLGGVLFEFVRFAVLMLRPPAARR